MAIELLFLLLLGYLLLGPRKSAGLARKAGGLFAQFNKVKAEFQASLQKELTSLDSKSGNSSKAAEPGAPPFPE